MNARILNGIRILGIATVALALNAAAVDVQIDNGTVLNASDIQDIMIDPTTGVIKISTHSGAFDIVDGGGNNTDPTPAVALLVNSSTSASVNQGTSVTVAWTVSQATSCSTLNGNTAWTNTIVNVVGGNSASSVSIPVDFVGARTFTLRCVNGAKTTTDSVSITGVSSDPDPQNSCPAEFSSSLSGSTVSWRSTLGFDWPNPTYSEKVVSIPTAGYLAIEFSTGDNGNIDGGMKTITNTSTDGIRYGAISRCPGDFSEQLPDSLNKCTREWFIGGTLNWSTETSPASYECKLQPNTTYYLNLTFTDGVSSASDSCVSTGSCRTTLRVFK